MGILGGDVAAQKENMVGNSQRFWVKKTDPWDSDRFLSKSSESLVKNYSRKLDGVHAHIVSQLTSSLVRGLAMVIIMRPCWLSAAVGLKSYGCRRGGCGARTTDLI